jgi:type I restriction enzyme R subunit
MAPAVRQEFHRMFSARWEESLDECRGTCPLRRPELAGVVVDSLRFFDGDRYFLTDFVVMPNHVHVLAAFLSPEQMLKQCASWKHYTAVQINRALGRRGHFWEDDAFDHLVRRPEQFEYLRKYVADNPRRAGLRSDDFVHYTRVNLE